MNELEFQTEYHRRLFEIQRLCEEEPQIELPLSHQFAPGVYLRTIFMPKGTFVIGKKHKTEHFNIVLTGSANVLIEGELRGIKAPSIFVSPPGSKKVLNILEDMLWATVHPTDETDMDELEKMMVCTPEEEKQLISEEVRHALRNEERNEERIKEGIEKGNQERG